MKKRVFAALMAGVMGTMMFGTTFVSAEAETPELKGEVYAFIAASLNNAMEEIQKNFNPNFVESAVRNGQNIRQDKEFLELCRLRLRKAPAATFSSQQLGSRWMHWLTRGLLTRIL